MEIGERYPDERGNIYEVTAVTKNEEGQVTSFESELVTELVPLSG
jgi:hypothetical protein